MILILGQGEYYIRRSYALIITFNEKIATYIGCSIHEFFSSINKVIVILTDFSLLVSIFIFLFIYNETLGKNFN